jgi:hypothetical protein
VRKHLTYTRAIWKVTSGELLTKQAMRKKIMYILKLFLNAAVTTRTEAPVVSGNKVLFACVKEVCRL